MKTNPAVFVVGDSYQIIVPVDEPSLMWVEVGGECYYDDSNGVLRSDVVIHRMTVPCTVLDEAKSYTVVECAMIARKPYYSVIGDEIRTDFAFRPIDSAAETVRAFQIADAHDHKAQPIAAARAFGDIDFLIFNGDISCDSGADSCIDAIYAIASELTGGNIPIVFSKGNHELRGIRAEKYVDYTPNDGGRTYYTSRLGPIWFLSLDCAEDKNDDHPEYGGTICCHNFRRRQTRFIEDVIRRADEEYAAEGTQYRVIVNHVSFTSAKDGGRGSCFDIERELFAEWGRLLRENVKPNLMICGHDHRLSFRLPGDSSDDLGHPCPIAVGSEVRDDGNYYTGMGLEFSGGKIKISFVNNIDGVKAVYEV